MRTNISLMVIRAPDEIGNFQDKSAAHREATLAKASRERLRDNLAFARIRTASPALTRMRDQLIRKRRVEMAAQGLQALSLGGAPLKSPVATARPRMIPAAFAGFDKVGTYPHYLAAIAEISGGSDFKMF